MQPAWRPSTLLKHGKQGALTCSCHLLLLLLLLQSLLRTERDAAEQRLQEVQAQLEVRCLQQMVGGTCCPAAIAARL